MELVRPMYNVHSYFSLKNLGKKVCIIHSKIWYCLVLAFESEFNFIIYEALHPKSIEGISSFHSEVSGWYYCRLGIEIQTLAGFGISPGFTLLR